MREIKFRAWVPKLKRMGKVSEINFMTGTLAVANNPIFSEIFRLRQVRLMQYTGLNDMYGRDIYENDIVEFELGLIRTKAEVVYSRSQFTVNINSVMSRSLGAYSVKVIGNKFQNPELLGIK